MRHRLSRRGVALASILLLVVALVGLKRGVSAQATTDSAARADEGARRLPFTAAA
jgi:hypothetical protein